MERQRQLHACTHRGCLRGCALSEAENFVFLKLKSCNMEYKCKFRSGDELKKKGEKGGKRGKKKEKNKNKNTPRKKHIGPTVLWT